MVECARLESVYTLIAYRGFESPSLRHYSTTRKGGFLLWNIRNVTYQLKILLEISWFGPEYLNP